jgi:hypothetical protein
MSLVPLEAHPLVYQRQRAHRPQLELQVESRILPMARQPLLQTRTTQLYRAILQVVSQQLVLQRIHQLPSLLQQAVTHLQVIQQAAKIQATAQAAILQATSRLVQQPVIQIPVLTAAMADSLRVDLVQGTASQALVNPRLELLLHPVSLLQRAYQIA